MLVSATTFGDVIDGYEFVSRIGLQDQRIAGQVEQAKKRAAEKRRATEHTQRLTAATVSVIAARTDEARAVRDELASNRDTLAAARRLKQSALATSQETREEYLRGGHCSRGRERIARCCDSRCSGRSRLDRNRHAVRVRTSSGR